MFKLNTIVTDKSTGLKGALTHYEILGENSDVYIFQPALINKENGKPVDPIVITEERIVGGIEVPEPEALIQAKATIGTEVTDNVTGFRGTVCGAILHMTGCAHVSVQSKELNAKTGAVGPAVDFDLRRLSGEAVPKLTESEMTKSVKEAPSPTGHTSFFSRRGTR